MLKILFVFIATLFINNVFAKNSNSFQVGDEVLVKASGYYDDDNLCEITSIISGKDALLTCKEVSDDGVCTTNNLQAPISQLAHPHFVNELPSAKVGDLLFSYNSKPYSAKAFVYIYENGNYAWSSRIKDQNSCWHQNDLYPLFLEYNNFPPFGPALGDMVIVRKLDEQTNLFSISEQTVEALSYEYDVDSYEDENQLPQNLPSIDTFKVRGVNYIFNNGSYADLNAIFRLEDPDLEAQFGIRPGELFIDGEQGKVLKTSKVLWNGCPDTFGGNVCASYLDNDFEPQAVIQDGVSGKWFASYTLFTQKFSKVVFVKKGDYIEKGKVKAPVNTIDLSGERIVAIKDPDYNDYEMAPEAFNIKLNELAHGLEKHAVVITDQLKKYFVFQCEYNNYYNAPDFDPEVQKICNPNSESGLLPIHVFAIEIL
ncbi:MAG: hypothetical protein IT287_07930 [Bdellovibrionaceae bacterium]|nr:hypothetical protein [Pseudobdellovibrionaceae bacterium]